MSLNLHFLQIPNALLEGLLNAAFERGSKSLVLRLPSFRDVVVASSLRHTTKGRALNRLAERRGLEHRRQGPLVDMDVEVSGVDVDVDVAAAKGNEAY
jgi:hypothetical protein